MSPPPVIGRFAPSPTGDLHFGSLVSALGSYLEARSIGGKWLIRVEDIDPPREVAGSAERIISDLRSLGMVPDGPILYQSGRNKAYQGALDHLLETGKAYHCGCSRKDLPASGIYPGTCRNGIPNGRTARSVRFLVPENACAFTDRLQGEVIESLADSCGDFVIHRADGLFAYQLAVVIDDDFQGVTQVVRGADLLESTNRQICLQRALGFRSPEYMHLPVVLAGDGKKLSKRTMADPVNHQDPVVLIDLALRFLGQCPPQGLSLKSLWDWALDNWDSRQIPRDNVYLSTTD